MFVPVVNGLRNRFQTADVQDDPNRWLRFATIVFFGPCAVANGASSLFFAARAIHALVLGAIAQCLWFSASAVLVYDVARLCWNLAKTARDRNAYYQIFPNIMIVDATGARGAPSGVWEIRKRQYRAISEKTLLVSFLLEFAVIPYFNSRYR